MQAFAFQSVFVLSIYHFVFFDRKTLTPLHFSVFIGFHIIVVHLLVLFYLYTLLRHPLDACWFIYLFTQYDLKLVISFGFYTDIYFVSLFFLYLKALLILVSNSFIIIFNISLLMITKFAKFDLDEIYKNKRINYCEKVHLFW